jgi:uncharacterized membrane protein YfcA
VPLDAIAVAVVALLASGLTLVTGFGLGTILTPVFAVLFPLPVAIAAVAVVHLANNLFKLALVGRFADRQLVIRFAVPAALAAVAGGAVLATLTGLPVVARYDLGGPREVTVLGIIVGVVLVVIALVELSPLASRLHLSRERLFLGGVVSGFLGGLSGTQGPIRAAVLLQAGLSKDAFVGTNVVTAVVVDLARLAVYGLTIPFASLVEPGSRVLPLVVVGSLAAFAGAYLGARALRRMSLGVVRIAVAALTIVVGIGLASGLI